MALPPPTCLEMEAFYPVLAAMELSAAETYTTIQAELDKNAYPIGIKVSTEDMKRLNLSPAKFHGKDWNYAIKPRQQRS